MKKIAPTILIVDDDELLREVLCDIFKEHSVSILEANSVDTAIEQLNAHQVDVIITDMQMPNKTGKELIEYINTHIKTKPRVFVCTGYSALTKEDALSMGVEEIFDKPFNISEIEEKVLR